MSPEWDGRWPVDKAAHDRLVDRAAARYEPIVAKLPPWEIGALIRVLNIRLKEIRVLADEEDTRRDRATRMDIGRTLDHRQYTDDVAT